MTTALLQQWPIKSNFKALCVFSVFLRWFPCHGDGFHLRRDSRAHGSCNQTPAFVLFDALQVDKRTVEGGGGEVRVGGGGGRGEERKVRQRSLVSAVCSQCDKRKKQPKRQREKREVQH